MTYKENITAILECHFTGFKQDIIDNAVNCIFDLSENKGKQTKPFPCEKCQYFSKEEQTCYYSGETRCVFDHLKENKGEWIKIQSGDKDFPESIVCSKCKNENSHLDFNEHGEPIGKVFVTSNFCPNCGADMRPEPYKAESEE